MSKDSERISDLNSKITATQAKTAADIQQSLDYAHTARVAKDEIKSLHGT
jgi:hypothetical protein